MAIATITPDQNAVFAEIFIAAPPARVFQAISDPAQPAKWWGQSGLYHVTNSTMDVRPGGKWRSDGTGTLVRVRQEGFQGDGANSTGHGEGWKRVLGWLEAFVEHGQTSAA